jgi:hypothetical protein
MFFLRRGMTWLGTTAIGLFCMANYPVLRAWRASAEQEARNQIGKFAQNEIRSAMPGRYQTMAEMKRALHTADAICSLLPDAAAQSAARFRCAAKRPCRRPRHTSRLADSGW